MNGRPLTLADLIADSARNQPVIAGTLAEFARRPLEANIMRGKGNARRGAWHGMATASDAAVAHACARHESLQSYAKVAAEIGVGASTIRDWVKGRTRALVIRRGAK